MDDQIKDIINEEVKQSKIIFMGDASVGKTSIIQTFMNGTAQMQSQVTPKCADFQRVITVNEDDKRHSLKLNIWDAAGDHDVRNLAHLYLRGVQVGVLVYSIDSRTSFQSLTDWLECLNQANESTLLFLVGNKSDLTAHRDVPAVHG